MIRLTIFLLCACTCADLCAQDPKAFAKNEIPRGWRIREAVYGDLNKDTRDDAAIVIQQEGDPDTQELSRTILVYFRKADGSFALAGKGGKVIDATVPGAMLTDSYGSIAIKKGILIVQMDGLGWGSTFRFRYQNNDFFLIGYTRIETTRATGDEESIDYNLSTGTMIREWKFMETPAKNKKKTYQIKPNPWPVLSTFNGYIKPPGQ